MKAKLNFKSKRTIIIASIIAVLAVGAGVGGYFYAKGNNQAGATNVSDGSTQTSTETPTTPQNDNNNGDNTPNVTPDNGNANNNDNGANTEDATNNGDNNDNANNGNAGDGAATNNGAAGNNAANERNTGNTGNVRNANAGNNGAANAGDDTDATTVIETVTDLNPWESHSVAWTPETLNVSTPEVNVNKNKIDVIKTAVTSTGYNTVSAGDTITYTLTIKNNNAETLNSLYISDEIPEGTTFVSAENDGKTIESNGKVAKVHWNLWNLGIEPEGEYSVSFIVSVNEGTKGTIKNAAVVEEIPSNETSNPVVISNKTASLVEVNEDGEEVLKELKNKEDKVKEGQIIRYTITATNTSNDEEATTKVTDTVPEGTTLQGEEGEEVTLINGKRTTTYSISDLNEGIEITLAKEGIATISFDVKVNKETSKTIKNAATVGGTTPTTENEVYIDINISKVWNDADNQDGKRPDEITVVLNKTVEEKTEEVKKATITSAKNWQYTFKDLPKYENGTEIEYTVEEVKTNVVTGTDAAGTYAVKVEGNYKEGITITNTHTPETTAVSGIKTWIDDNDRDGIRTKSITVNLLADGTKVASKQVTANDNWEYSFTGIDKYKDGKEIKYTITEESVTGYRPSTSGYDLTNTHDIDTTSVTVNKTWIDSDNADKVRPTKITVNLLADGQLYKSIDITPDNAGNWTYTFANLPKNNKGKQITYTVSEENVDGYKSGIKGSAANGYTITNTETTSISGTKTWEDNDDADGIRPSNITVNLLADGKNVESKTVTANDNWAYSFTNLPKYNTDGTQIDYALTENPVEGYETKVTGNNIKNIILKSDISVTKKQYMYNEKTEKYEEVPKNTEVRADDTIMYLLEATNNGNKQGKTTIKDPKPANAQNVEAWVDADGDFVKDSNETTVDLTKLNENGYEVTVPANSKVVVAYKITVDGYANDTVTNTAYYKNEDDDDYTPADETRVVKIEDDMEIVPTTSEGGEVIPQTTVLVLDYSNSMKGSRIEALEQALLGTSSKVGFFESYFGSKTTANGNKLYIITYNSTASSAQLVESYTAAKAIIDKASTAHGTNTIAGLNRAKTISDTNKDISVVLMTDGVPSYYANGTRRDGGNETINSETVAVATSITDNGNSMYIIGFGVGKTGVAIDFVNKMTSEEEGPKATYYTADDSSALVEAFETVVSEITNKDGKHSTESTTNGIITIKEGFTKGQDVEIYKGTYTEGSSKPYATFTWDNFLSSGYASYDEDEKEITFNLGKYMEDERMATYEEVIVRFVAEGTAGKTKSSNSSSTNGTKSLKSVSSTKALSLTMDVVEKETTTAETVSKYEEKFDEAETNNKSTVVENNDVIEKEIVEPETTESNEISEENTSNEIFEENTANDAIEENTNTVELEKNNEIQTEEE